MSFFKNLLRGEPEGNDEEWVTGQCQKLEKVIDQSRPIFKQCAALITAEAQKIAGPRSAKASENHLFATALIFSVIWQLVGWAWHGVKASVEKDPKRRENNPVFRLWEINRAAFGTADEEECKQEVDKLHLRWGITDE